MKWTWNSAANNDPWYIKSSGTAAFMVFRANSPYDPWYPVDATTDSARWYNFFTAKYNRELVRGSKISIIIRDLFPVSGNRYSNYWRMYLIPANDILLTQIQGGALNDVRLRSIRGCTYRDVMPLGTNQSKATLKGYIKPSQVYGFKGGSVMENQYWNATGANPPSSQAAYWILVALPLKVNTASEDATSIKNSMFINVNLTMYTEFRAIANPLTFNVNDDDLATTDNLGTGEPDITVAGDITDIPGTHGAN